MAPHQRTVLKKEGGNTQTFPSVVYDVPGTKSGERPVFTAYPPVVTWVE
jgi:hypothetical protein